MDESVEDLLQGLVNWREVAACRDTDPDLFFPNGTGTSGQMQTDRAKAVCHGCLVIDHCLGFALRTDQAEGIWGGLTAHERDAARRVLPSAPTVTNHASSSRHREACSSR